MHQHARLPLTAGVCLTLAATTVVAQERFGELFGSVSDATQAAVPNTSIVVTHKETGRSTATQ
jgi:hypothetical protein